MELTVDWALGFVIMAIALSIAMYQVRLWFMTPAPALLSLTSLEGLRYRLEYPVDISLREDGAFVDVVAEGGKSVRVTVVLVWEGGVYQIVEGITPLRVPRSELVVAFAGSTVRFLGYLAGDYDFYVTRHGVYSQPVETPYARVENGSIVEVNPREVTLWAGEGMFKALVLVNGTLMEATIYGT